MDSSSDSSSSLWSRIVGLFQKNHEELLEKAINDAREEGELEASEGTMLLSVLRLDELQVQDIMVPRTDIACVPEGTSISEIIDIITATGHSRIPVYKETRDNIVGLAYAKDLLPLLKDKIDPQTTIDSFVRPVYMVPETKKVKELLQEFRSRKTHLAIAVDEYGGTSGIATIEDVIEVIVGDIEDEYDAPKVLEINANDDGSLTLSGRAMLEELEEYGIYLPTEEVETIGGYLCLLAGRVPSVGEEFKIDGRVFKILESDSKQIRLIRASEVMDSAAEAS